MVACDLILSQNGDVVFIQDEPFARDIIRVEFYLENGYLILVDDTEDTRLIEYEITDQSVMSALTQATSILLAYIENDAPQGGFEVPLITVSA